MVCKVSGFRFTILTPANSGFFFSGIFGFGGRATKGLGRSTNEGLGGRRADGPLVGLRGKLVACRLCSGLGGKEADIVFGSAGNEAASICRSLASIIAILSFVLQSD